MTNSSSTWFDRLPVELLEYIALIIVEDEFHSFDCAYDWTNNLDKSSLNGELQEKFFNCLSFQKAHTKAREAFLSVLRMSRIRLFLNSQDRYVEEEQESGLFRVTMALFGIERIIDPTKLHDYFLEAAFTMALGQKDAELLGLLIAGSNSVGRYFVSSNITFLRFLVDSSEQTETCVARDLNNRGLHALASTHSDQCLSTATLIEDVTLLEKLLYAGFGKTATSGAALLRAVSCRNLALVCRLLQDGIDPNDGDFSVLLEAVRMGDSCYDIIAKLLENGADVNFDDDRALRDAVDPTVTNPPSLRLIELLLQFGADPNALGASALLTAARFDQTDVVDVLLAYGAQSDIALVYAIRNNNERMVQMLLQGGSDPTANSKQALVAALVLDNQAIINVLLKAVEELSS